MLVNQLRLPVAAEQQREIVEPGDDALQLDALDQEHGHRGLALAKGVEENILEILVFIGHICLLFLAVKPRVRRRFSPTFKTFLPNRSEERRVGKECGVTCNIRW